MPMKLSLEFVAIICANGLNTEGKFFNKVIDKVDCILLIVYFENFLSSNPSGIINGCVLEACMFSNESGPKLEIG